jgi:hypothetical protein
MKDARVFCNHFAFVGNDKKTMEISQKSLKLAIVSESLKNRSITPVYQGIRKGPLPELFWTGYELLEIHMVH